MNSYNDQNSIFQQPPVVKNAAYYRQRARAALKNCYWYALLAALLAGFLGAHTGGEGNISIDTSSFDLNIEVTENSVRNFVSAFAKTWSEGGITAVIQAHPWIAMIAVGFVSALVFGFLFSLLVGAPVTLGYERYKLDVIDGGGRDIKVLFRYFKQSYKKSIALRVVHSLINFAASIPMLIVVGIFGISTLQALAGAGSKQMVLVTALLCVVFAWVTAFLQIWLHYRYRFCYMIMAEYPEIGVIDALRNSAQLMKGNKWKLFCLDISFIGWILLSIFTCGIGAIFLTPYTDTASAAFYDEIANRQAAKNAVFPSLNPDDYAPDGEA